MTIKVPLSLVRLLGVTEAFLLCYPLKRKAESAKEDLSITIVKAEEETGVNEYHQRKILSKLKSRGLLSVRPRGQPPSERFIFMYYP